MLSSLDLRRKRLWRPSANWTFFNGFKNFWRSEPFSYDISSLKSATGRRAFSLNWGLVTTGVLALAGYLAVGHVAFLLWFGLYAMTYWLGGFVLSDVPPQIGRRRFLVIGAYFILHAISYVWIIWFLWLEADVMLHIFGLIVYASAMISALHLRYEDQLSGFCTMSVVVLTGIFMGGHCLYYSTGIDQRILFAFGMTALLINLGLSFQDASIVRARQKRMQQIESDQAKFQALGQLTGGVAHDFNNLLTVILGNLDLCQSGGVSESDRDELLNQVNYAALRASALTGQLLAYSRRSNLETQLTNPRDVVERARKLLDRLIPASYQLEVRIEGSTNAIEVDVGKLETVIVNLVVNARDAMPGGGTIQISLRDYKPRGKLNPDPTPTQIFGQPLAPGDYIELRVTDYGSGIAPEILSKVVEPYYTTKPVGKGSGLGLPLALGFSEQSGGTLRIESEPGYGTSVSLLLPAIH